jgi:hypothetical protein
MAREGIVMLGLLSRALRAALCSTQRTEIRAGALMMLAIGLSSVATPAAAINIVLNFDSGQSESPSFDPDGSKLTAIMQAAELHYQDIIEDSHTLTINYWWEDLADGLFGQHRLVSQSGGRETEADVRLDTQSGGVEQAWFFDTTPQDDSEYAMQQILWRDLSALQQVDWFNGSAPDVFEVGYRGNATASAPAAAQNGRDALSTAFHEIGHALGMSTIIAASETADLDYDTAAAFLAGVSVGIEVEAADNIAHFADGVAVMCTGCGGPGIRRRPSAADVFALAAASDWIDIDLPRKDFLSGASWNTAANWEGNAVPGTADDAFIRRQSAIVNTALTANGFAQNLLVGEADTLSTANHKLDISQTTTIDGTGLGTATRIFIPTGGEFETADLSLVSGNLSPRGGVADIQDSAEVDADSFIEGYGTILVATRLNNNGTLQATNNAVDLVFTTAGAGVWDLDGTSGNGIVLADQGNMQFTGTLPDDFDGDMTISPGRSITFHSDWELGNDGVLNLVAGTLAGSSSILAGQVNVDQTSEISSPVTFQSTASVAVPDSNDVLRLTGATTYNGGTFSGSGMLQQTGDAVVAQNTTIDVAKFDWDGTSGSNQTTINDGHTLTINSTQIDLNPASDGFDGDVFVNGGRLVVNTPAAWRLDGTLHLTGSGDVNGSPITVVGDIVATGGINFFSDVEFRPTSSVTVAGASDLLRLRGVTTYHGGSYTGLGTIRQLGDAVIAANTTIDVAIYDWDGVNSSSATSSTTVNPGVTFTINSSVIEESGAGYGGSITVADTASLQVNTDAPWTISSSGSMTLGGSTARVGGVDIINDGTIEGVGRIETNLTNQRTVSPSKSAGILNVVGNYTQTSIGTLRIELGGLVQGSQHDLLSITGVGTLAGTLDVSLLNLGGGLFIPGFGDTFQVVAASGGILGSFTTELLPTLGANLDWDVIYGPKSVLLTVVSALPGDYNFDGTVDAADYVVWRKTDGTPAAYDTWRANFNESIGNGSGARGNATVPEPAALVMLMFAAAGWCVLRRPAA